MCSVYLLLYLVLHHADMVGRLWVYHAALGLFLGSSIGCALSPNIALFLVGRCVDGCQARGQALHSHSTIPGLTHATAA